MALSGESSHLGGSVIGGDPFTWCPNVWSYVISRFAVTSAMDLGSGSGNASLWLFRKGIQVVSVDGFRDSVSTALYPAVQHDITTGPLYTKVDLVHCQEVVEHIEEQYLSNLIETLVCGKVILLTHALPGQLGHHHVNLKPSEYWIEKIENRGCKLLAEDTKRVRDIAKKEGAIYMADTGMVFANYLRK